MEFNVADLVEAAADRVPEREILVCGPDRLTYAQLDARANRLAHYFQSLGIERDQHIGIYGFNSSRWVEAMLAAYKIRAVPINVNYRYVEDELFYLFDNADLVALVHDAQFAPRIANVLAERSEAAALHRHRRRQRAGLLARSARCAYEQALAHGSPGARLRATLWRRSLRALHRRHDREAEGRDVAPSGRDLHARRRHRSRHQGAGRVAGDAHQQDLRPLPHDGAARAAHARRGAVGRARAAVHRHQDRAVVAAASIRTRCGAWSNANG